MAARVRNATASIAATAMLVGCSLIVPSEVPAYRCTGAEPGTCPTGLVCDTSARLCVPAPTQIDGGEEDAITEDEGGTDAGRDRDAPSGPSPLGGECVVDGDCTIGLLCGTSTILTTAIVPTNSKPICTKPCCTSADCASGFVCFSGGTGGNYCVAADRADRTPPATGGRTGGQSCSDHDQCRSGLCRAGRCVDTCCEPSQCATGSTCRISTLDTHTAWACGAPNGGSAKDVGTTATCVGNADCKNDNCVQPFSASRRCTPTCCSAKDCTDLGFTNNVCAYGSAGNDQLKWCFEPNASGKGAGVSCTANSDCASRYCDSELGKCANVCCTTADCANGESCRPSPVGTPFLRCVKNR